MLITVYDPHGRMFELAPHIARNAVIVHGWTSVPPEQVKPVFGIDQQVGVEHKPSEDVVPVADPQVADTEDASSAEPLC